MLLARAGASANLCGERAFFRLHQQLNLFFRFLDRNPAAIQRGHQARDGVCRRAGGIDLTLDGFGHRQQKPGQRRKARELFVAIAVNPGARRPPRPVAISVESGRCGTCRSPGTISEQGDGRGSAFVVICDRDFGLDRQLAFMGEKMLDLEHNPLSLLDGGIEFRRERAKLRDCLLEFIHVIVSLSPHSLAAPGGCNPTSSTREAIGERCHNPVMSYVRKPVN